MPKPGEIRYCPELGGQETNAAFVWIPPGSFWMGDKREYDNPVHFVTLTKGFWLQQTPLTDRQYSNKNSDLPQVEISWDDVVIFCKDKPLRMPTEAEWEYAARANTGHKYPWAGSNIADNVAWTWNNSKNQAHEVGQLKSNSRGLFDMSGNAYEWCSDCYEAEQSSTPQINPIGLVPGSYCVNRGGSRYDASQFARVAHRNFSPPDFRFNYLGARLVWEPQNA